MAGLAVAKFWVDLTLQIHGETKLAGSAAERAGFAKVIARKTHPNKVPSYQETPHGQVEPCAHHRGWRLCALDQAMPSAGNASHGPQCWVEFGSASFFAKGIQRRTQDRCHSLWQADLLRSSVLCGQTVKQACILVLPKMVPSVCGREVFLRKSAFVFGKPLEAFGLDSDYSLTCIDPGIAETVLHH